MARPKHSAADVDQTIRDPDLVALIPKYRSTSLDLLRLLQRGRDRNRQEAADPNRAARRARMLAEREAEDALDHLEADE